MKRAERLQQINEGLQGLIEDGHIDGKLLEDAFGEVLVQYEKLVTLILVPREKSEVRSQISGSGTRNEKRDTEP